MASFRILRQAIADNEKEKIPAYNLVIEFDGQQHYTKEFMGKKLPNITENDFLKNAFCKKKGIHLLRIKYTDINNIDSIICAKFDLISPIN